MAQKNILFENEKEEIRKEIIDIFGEEGAAQLAFDLIKFKNALDNIISEMKLEEYSFTSYWTGEPIHVVRRRMSKEVTRRNYLALKGFMFIFKFREYLFNEKIDYRYYFQDEKGVVNARSFGEMDLIDFTMFSEGAIKLNIKEIIDKGEEGKKYFTLKMNQYINRYTKPDKNKYMQKRNPALYNLRIVRSHIMSKYNPPNKGLKTKDGQSYQTFNMGHIYESLDLALVNSVLEFDEEQRNSQLIDALMFGRYLKRDTVIASKGGDNFFTNTNIKSNSANLYNFNTISNQLYIIQQMLKTTSKENILKDIKYLFIDKSEKSNIIKQDLEDKAQQATNKLLEEIQKKLTN